MERTTHRQHLIWLEWIREEYDNPKPSDYYLMQIACEVRRVLSKKPDRIRLKHFKLSFSRGKAKQRMTPEQRMAISKAAWFGALGLGKPPAPSSSIDTSEVVE